MGTCVCDIPVTIVHTRFSTLMEPRLILGTGRLMESGESIIGSGTLTNLVPSSFRSYLNLVIAKLGTAFVLGLPNPQLI